MVLMCLIQVKLDAATLQRNVNSAASFACKRPSERHVRDVEELECERCRAENKKRGVQPEDRKTSHPLPAGKEGGW